MAKIILVVDSNKDEAETLRIMLKRLGYETIISNDSEGGIYLIKKDPNFYSAVFVSYNMPRILGLEVARAAKEANPLNKVVMLLSSNQDQEQLKVADHVINRDKFYGVWTLKIALNAIGA